MHRTFMAQALELAAKGLYTTNPNPRVGCVLVKENKVIAAGWHQYAGQPHAEIMALNQAGSLAEGATAYVTLEPCSHQGKTGPCAQALINAGVSRVVGAMTDPNPLVAGSGYAMLRQAGVEVITDIMAAEAAALNPGFIKRMKTGLPLVRLKMAMSIDGRTAMASGESKWITGPEARAEVHKLRARSSAVVTGIGTVLADNPSMTVRPAEFDLGDIPFDDKHQPIPVILDSGLRIPAGAAILQGNRRALIVSACDPSLRPDINRLQSQADVKALPGEQGNIDLPALLGYLAELQCNEVLVECGSVLAGALISQRLVDELIIFMAPALMGSHGRPLFELPLSRMSEKINLKISSVEPVGEDWCIRAKPVYTG